MISEKALKSLEFDKIKEIVLSYAVLEKTGEKIKTLKPSIDYDEIINRLKCTQEAYKLLYDYSVNNVDFFDEITDELDKANVGSTLSMAELLRVGRLLKTSRTLQQSIIGVQDESIVIISDLAKNILTDESLERDIFKKILSEDQMADDASEKLYAIRKNIIKINAKIREKLSNYISGGSNKYLQDNIVTMRQDRYVIPVKSEYKGQVKGLIHDQSASGSTLFIEPIEVLELNNELRENTLQEIAEINRILADLTLLVGKNASRLKDNIEYATQIDLYYSLATYAYKTNAIMPKINTNGYINIVGGKHPLIDKDKVVPISIALGKGYRYLLITGPNTGGKTVSMKLVGLYSVMATSGMFLPTDEVADVSVFESIYTDIGDEQSIEQSLSTFSSHMKNLIHIVSRANDKSLVLIDEIGAGTDPDEGSALAVAILDDLVNKSSYGIVTTHYTTLKEYAYTNKAIMNASMDFNPQTFEPKYKINIGIAGSSNAIEISRRLGLSKEIIDKAYGLIGENKIAFEKVLREAELSRKTAEEETEKHKRLTKKAEEEYAQIQKERQKFEEEKSKFFTSAKIESRRIVNEKEEEADELLSQIKNLLKKQELSQNDVFTARSLKNKIADKKFDVEESDDDKFVLLDRYDENELSVGLTVYSKKLDKIGQITKINDKKHTVEISSGNMRYTVELNDLYKVKSEENKPQKTVSLPKKSLTRDVQLEINVIGLNQDEALFEVEAFIDKAIYDNLESVRIVHGKGMHVLSKAIQNYLKTRKEVKGFRFGGYGEGENGVTIVSFK